ncbi:hypothetical protein JL475_28765 [Streptomyces sp. M2CJ-2]|nr:hypothetical protein [Streptomyces sp. M2CJ-2]
MAGNAAWRDVGGGTAPRSDRSPRVWTYASGAAELAPTAGVALPQTRKAAAPATAAFFAGVLPARVAMAVDRSRRPAPQRVATRGRLPPQVPPVLWARGVAKGAKGRW